VASRFLVATGTWTAINTAIWSATDGGASGASVPTASDDVFFTALSGAAVVTTSGTTVDVCRSLDCTGFTGTLTHASATTIVIGTSTVPASNVALKLVPGMTYTRSSAVTSAWSFVSTSATQQTIDFSTKATAALTINGAGSSYLLNSNISMTTATLTLTSGTFDASGKTIDTATFTASGAVARTFTLGAGALNISSTGVGWNTATSTNFTMTANTGTITFTGAAVSPSTGGLNFNGASIVFTGGGVTAIAGGLTCKNLTVTGTASRTDSFAVGAMVISGTLTMTGNSATNRLLWIATGGVAQSCTAAVVSLTNLDVSDRNAFGAAIPFSGTSLGDAGGNNANWTFTTPVSRFWVGGTGLWSATSSWSATTGGVSGATVPLPQDTVTIDNNSGSGFSFTMDMPRMGANVTFSITNSCTYVSAGVTLTCYGSFTYPSALTNTWGNSITFAGRSSQTLTSNSKSFGFGVSFTAIGGTYTLQDAFQTAAGITLNNGTLNTNSVAVSCTVINSANTNTRSLTLGTSTLSLTGTGTVLNLTGSPTISAASATISVADTSATAKTLLLLTATWGTVNYANAGTGSLTLTHTGATIGTLAVSGAAKTLTLTSAQTLTISTAWSVNGTAGNLVTLNASTAASAATISKASGVVSSDYLSIQDSTATGGATWYAGANSTNVSNNTGWIFTAVPSGASNQYFTMLGIG
jgi:hypothetical protein